MAIDREYYHFERHAELIEKEYGLSRNDLIDLGETGQLPFCVIPQYGLLGFRMARSYSGCKGKGYAPHRPCFITKQQLDKVFRAIPFDSIYLDREKDEAFYLLEPFPFTESDLVVMASDLEAFKQETPKEESSHPEENRINTERIYWGWGQEMRDYTGLSGQKIRYRAEQLGYIVQPAEKDPENKKRVGLFGRQLDEIIKYKRSNGI